MKKKINKYEIPPQFLPRKTRPVHSSLYGFTNNLPIIFYVPKQNRAVVLVYSMHRNISTDNEKPKISYYHCNKGGALRR